MMGAETTIHRAAWVVPVASPPVRDGAVVCARGRIVAAGSFATLRDPASRVVDHGAAILTPALINAHSHLELSHLAALGKSNDYFPSGAITAWIGALLAARERASGADPLAAARLAAREMKRSGIIATADIGNDPAAEAATAESGMIPLFFLELLGLGREAGQRAIVRFSGQAASVRCTVHAPYSCHPELIQAAKARARLYGHLFPVHVAESEAELEFLASGSGPFAAFLQTRVGNPASTEQNGWRSSFVPPGCGAVAYLERLGVLDERTLLVHGVHLGADELELIAQRRAKVCLCPGSNRFLGVGTAQVGRMREAGLTLALGTDSLASSPALDLWREMRILREDHPGLEPAAVFAMATQGGAEALGLAELGALAPGKRAVFLRVHPPLALNDGRQLYEYLSSAVTPSQVGWVE